jgi:hypothetical protein
MKKIYFLLALALTFVFTSCTMEKRHHRNGYYISWNHQTPKTGDQTTSAVTEKQTAAQDVVSEETSVALPTDITPIVSETVTPATIATSIQSVTPSTNLTEKAENAIVPSKSNIKQAARSQRNAEKQSAPETDLVLLEILKWVGLAIWLALPVLLLILPATQFDSGNSWCPSQLLLKRNCPGCGLTRAVQHSIHLDFKAAFGYNKLILLVLPALVILYLHILGRLLNKEIFPFLRKLY